MLRPLGISIILTGAVAFAGPASAAIKTYTFENITNNKATDAAIGEAQLSVKVFDHLSAASEFGLLLDEDQVGFRFENSGPSASSITDVYFDDGTLLGIASIHEGPGVRFSQGASPGNLPGGQSIGFQTTAGFLADSDSPHLKANGVEPGEYLIIVFDLINGQDYYDTIDALAFGRTPPEGQDGSLRIGIHVQGFAGGGSESFVNSPPADGVVPEPATLVLWSGLGLLAGCGALRRGRRQAN
jgi:hypothetical protein